MRFEVTDQSGERHQCDADTGTTMMQAIRDAGLEIAAQCGGCCSCATCHVYVDEEWQSKLPAATEEELAMLELAMEVTPHSRLSCQIVAEDSLNGMKIILAPGTTL